MNGPIEDLGIIVNDREGMDKANDREGHIKQLTTDEAVIPVRVPDAIFDRMVKAAQFHQYPTVEAWAASTLIQSLTTKIGAPSIDSPGSLNNQAVRKVTGPSNSGAVRRA